MFACCLESIRPSVHASVQPFLRSLVCCLFVHILFTHSFVRSFACLFVCSFPRSLIRLFASLLVRSFVCVDSFFLSSLLVRSLSRPFLCSFSRSLVYVHSFFLSSPSSARSLALSFVPLLVLSFACIRPFVLSIIPFVGSFARSRSFSRSFVCVHSFFLSSLRSFIRSFSCSFIRYFYHPFVCSFV